MEPELNGAAAEEQELGWGRSLPVPSVQEIVRKDPNCVPERYIRGQIKRDEISELPELHIPVIDFSKLSGGDEAELNKLDLACKDWGFFQIVHHGISEDVLYRVRNAMAAFFDLPIEEKKRYAMADNDLQGYGQAYVVSAEQKLDWNDLVYLMTEPIRRRSYRYWPTTVRDFKDALTTYSDQAKRVAMQLLSHLSLLMNMNREGLLNLHGEMGLGMRLNYYPACSRPDEVMGVSPHSDGSSITILWQDEDIAGLQIKHEGEWIPVEPIPHALVVNIGDAIEAWSNGIYQSIEHRAVTNERKSRMSLATFVIPDENAEIGPLQQMLDATLLPKMYRNVKYLDYIRYTLARKMEGKAHTHLLKLEQE
ncbi:protein SRG1-like [Zingiber officinale]|uniref:Fe2OG dioxygenase domain-containing protein n=1 Tax=Zingiber officinale TaxID=94328 RepID=A0A8J5KQ87_ZINOF|nr:protein SRG1-like [Zingiber officinale]KAG6487309.1 hypothetical protein ZIOFF_055895 [Zingiber officinale]